VPESDDPAQPSRPPSATTTLRRPAGSGGWPRRLGRALASGQYRALKLTALLLAVTGLSALIGSWRRFFDLFVYFGAVHYWTAGGPIYDFVAPQSTYGFTYTPFAALSLLPLAIVPWPVAIVVSCLGIIAATVLVVRWFVIPLARRHGWEPWYAIGIVMAGLVLFDPLRETFLFGQVNMYLVALVGFDLLILTRRGSRFAGLGIGLATALKLTPGVFLIYLLVTGRWRAALTACSAAAGATLVAAAVLPDESRVFWTDALWNTDRVGQLDYISNQSLNGAVARLNPLDPSTLLWALAVVAVLVVWVIRARRAAAAGDERTGFALTGVVTCLISPITWVHHLVWVLPALLVLLDRVLALPRVRAEGEDGRSRDRRRSWLWALLVVSYVILGSRVIWAFQDDTWGNPVAWFISNAYLWVSLALLIGLPLAKAPEPVALQSPEPVLTAAAPTSGPAVKPSIIVDGALAGRRREAPVPVGDAART
jgi:alpha-1,2-mannosyltransferase